MKTSRELVKNIREVYPESRATDIAKILEISNERVRQHFKKLNLQTNFRIKTFCSVCSNQTSTGKKYCSNKCRKSVHSTTLSCDHCHQDFTLSKADYNTRVRTNKHFYCSNPCRINAKFGPMGLRLDQKDLTRRKLVRIGRSYGFILSYTLLKDLNWVRERDTFVIKRINDSIVITKNEY